MKKKVLLLLLVNILMILCVGCSNERQNEVLDTQNLQGNTENNTVDHESKIEEKQDGILYSELSEDTLVTDVNMLQNALNLVVNESAFVTMLDSDWPDNEEIYEINGGQYLLVEEATSWDFFEDQAKNYYAEEFIEEEFTPWYTEDGRIFLEQDGKLYRAMSDGVGASVLSDTIEVWQVEENLYYITIQYESDTENDVRGFVVKEAEEKPYGFVIVDKVSVN